MYGNLVVFLKKHNENIYDVYSRINKEINKLIKINSALTRRKIFSLASDKLLPDVFDQLKINIYDRNATPRFFSDNNKSFYIYWLLGVLNKNSDGISNFIRKKKEFNGAVLSGNGEKALSILNDVSEFTISWWAIENEFYIRTELFFGLDNIFDIDAELKLLESKFEGVHSVRLKNLIDSMANGRFEVSVQNLLSQVNNIRSSGIEHSIESIDGLSCVLFPIQLDPERVVSFDVLVPAQNETLIDQYIMLTQIVLEMRSKNIQFDPDLEKMMLDLAEKVSDSSFKYSIINSTTTSDFVLKAVNLYTSGDYSSVVSMIKEKILIGDECISGLLEIYWRSRLYVNECDETFFVDKLANKFASIARLDEDSIECMEYLRGIIIKFRGEQWAKSLAYHWRCLLIEVVDCSFNNNSLTDCEINELVRCNTLSLGEFNTPRSNFKEYNPITSWVDSDKVTFERKLRYSSYLGDYSIGQFDEIKIKSDYISVRCRALMENEEWFEVMKFSFEQYSLNDLAYMFIPFKSILKKVLTLDASDPSFIIMVMITLDIYSRNINGGAYEKEIKSLFEDFLNYFEEIRPSKIKIFNGDLNERDVYFLKNICVTSLLYSIPEYTRSYDVISERLDILDVLIDNCEEICSALEDEKYKTIESVLSEKLRAKIEYGKLFVDVQALKNSSGATFKDFFISAKMHCKLKIDTAYDLAHSLNSDVLVDSSLVNFDKISDERLDENGDIFLKIYSFLVKEFALNDDYGLDKYISAQIRHTDFITQIRSCFEICNLITVSDDNGYKSNDHWYKIYYYVNKIIVIEIDSLLKTFSHNVDNLICEINSKFSVSLQPAGAEGVFNFCVNDDRLRSIESVVINSPDYEIFFDGIMTIMWDILAGCALNAQLIIANDFRPRMMCLIDNLESDINSVRDKAPMSELIGSISILRTNLLIEIENVESWFRSVGFNDQINLEGLNVVIDASALSFKSMCYLNNDDFILSSLKSNLLLTYGEVKALFVSMFIGMQSAEKCKVKNTAILVVHSIHDSYDEINISNNFYVNDLDSYGGSDEFVTKMKAKWCKENSSLSRKEGGSGLYKIHNLLSNSSDGFDFDIEIINDVFNICIRINHEYFIGRG